MASFFSTPFFRGDSRQSLGLEGPGCEPLTDARPLFIFVALGFRVMYRRLRVIYRRFRVTYRRGEGLGFRVGFRMFVFGRAIV